MVGKSVDREPEDTAQRFIFRWRPSGDPGNLNEAGSQPFP
jgi:hypothetical protein